MRYGYLLKQEMNTLKQRTLTISIIILLLVTSTTEVWSFQLSEKIENKDLEVLMKKEFNLMKTPTIPEDPIVAL